MSTDDDTSSPRDAEPQSDHAIVELETQHLRPQQDGGNGEQERYIDKTSPQENDGRSETVTGFDPRDAPSGERVYREGQWMDKWEWFNQLNDGVQDKERGKQNWRAGKRNDAKLIADHLSLAPSERDKLVRMAEEIDFNNFGSHTTEQVLVGCASLVSDENTTVYENRIILQDEFRELMEVLGMGSKEHRQIRQSIRDRTDFF